MRRSFRKYSRELLSEAVSSSTSWRQVCESLGLKPLSGNESFLKKRSVEYEIDFSHFPGKSWARGSGSHRRKPISEHLVSCITKITSNTLRRYLIDAGLKKDLCERCGLSVWLGNPIRFQLHHKNGEHHDNTLSNLEILCPNCHSWETYNRRVE